MRLISKARKQIQKNKINFSHTQSGQSFFCQNCFNRYDLFNPNSRLMCGVSRYSNQHLQRSRANLLETHQCCFQLTFSFQIYRNLQVPLLAYTIFSSCIRSLSNQNEFVENSQTTLRKSYNDHKFAHAQVIVYICTMCVN